jgi:hypothetical protein
VHGDRGAVVCFGQRKVTGREAALRLVTAHHLFAVTEHHRRETPANQHNFGLRCVACSLSKPPATQAVWIYDPQLPSMAPPPHSKPENTLYAPL